MFIKTDSKPVPNADPDQYHLIGAEIPKGKPEFVMSRSQLAEFGTCPRKWIRAPKEKASKSMQWGSLIDTMVLTPELFDKKFSVAPEMYPCEPTKKDPRSEKPWNYQATHCKEWREEQEAAGFRTTDATTLAEARAAVALLFEDPIFREVFDASQRQVQIALAWKDEGTGLIIPVKVLADLVPKPDSKFGSMLVDFKTTADAAPDAWQRHTINFDLHYQAALYLDAINCAFDLNYSSFANIVQESAAPFEVARRIFHSDFLEMGRDRYRRDFAFYCQCLKTNRWPGYEDFDTESMLHPVVEGFRVVYPPTWALRKAAAEKAD